MFSPLSIFARSHTVIYDYYAFHECIDDRKSQPTVNEKRLSTTSTLYSDDINIEKMSSALNVGIIVCSTRKNRICPQVVDFVLDTITQSKSYQSSPNRPQFTKIDLENWNLPFFDETTIPSQIHNYNDYSQPHTKAWSQEIQKYDSFIFITPQYNWGYPAVLKNAIDFLYNEWTGKPAMIVSYGGHGGDKCNAQLRQVLTGIKMPVTQRSVHLTFPGRDVTAKACRGENLNLDVSAKTGMWIAEQKNIRDAYDELVSMPSISSKYS